MKIKIKMDNGKAPKETFIAPIIRLIEQNLSVYGYRIVTLKVHLSEENGTKDDRRCMLYARIEGFKPIVITSTAESHIRAVQDATDKLNEALHDLFYRSQN